MFKDKDINNLIFTFRHINSPGSEDFVLCRSGQKGSQLRFCPAVWISGNRNF